MLKSLNKRFILLIAMTAVYNFVFWHEKAGVNFLLFSVLISFAVLFVNPPETAQKKLILMGLLLVYSGITIILFNSAFSIFSFIVLTIIFAGYSQQNSLKSIYTAIITIVSSWVLFPYNVLEGVRKTRKKHKIFAFILKSGKLVLIPVIILTVFYSLYAYANPMFNTYSESFWDLIGNFMNNIFYDYPFLRIIFICFGIFFITGLIYNNNIHIFADLENKLLDFLYRDKTRKLVWNTGSTSHIPFLKKMHLIAPKISSLVSEYRIGLILIVMVNILILILNIIDIKFLWLGFDSKQVNNLAYYVHEGTYVLIFSMLLSIVILLYLFRGNINFYGKNRLLKYGAYMWIIQNIFMAVSVSLRNYYYIEYYYALSYKRIGVFIFLLVALAGLFTIFLKIGQKRTTYNIIKISGAVLIAVMLAASSFDWDTTIAEFNLSNPDKKNIDIRFLLSLSDNVLPALDKNKNVLEMHNNDFTYSRKDADEISVFNSRKTSFMKEYNTYSWLSWNYPHSRTYNYFSQQNSITK